MSNSSECQSSEVKVIWRSKSSEYPLSGGQSSKGQCHLNVSYLEVKVIRRSKSSEVQSHLNVSHP